MLKKKNWCIVSSTVCPVTETIINLAAARGITKTICPSEVARQLWPGEWRKHMPEVREAAFILREKGYIRILQKGTEILEDEIKGPIRIQII